jgi:tripartite-type tricarboxylate transporter receptor subunit TctC
VIIRRAGWVTIAAALFAPVPHAFAQGEPAGAYPARPIRIVVPFTPGSATDIMARSVSDQLAAGLGQPVVVENRPGAGGTIGTAVVAKSVPDGYTLVVVSAGHAVNPAIYEMLPYDTAKDFAGVIPLGNLPSVLFVSPALGVKTVQELIALARSKPGALNYSSAGIGSASHVNAEKFRVATGISAVHVPLKGAPEMVTETLAGRTHFGLVGIVSVVPPIRDGRLLGLAVSSAKRSSALPQVPTIAEAGVPEAQFDFWIGMLAPAQTPRGIVNRLHDEIARVLRLPQMQERLANLGAEPMPMSPEQFDAYMSEQLAVLGGLLRAAGVKAN